MVHFTLSVLFLLHTHPENLLRDGTRADFVTDVFSVLWAHGDAFVIRNVCNAIIIFCFLFRLYDRPLTAATDTAWRKGSSHQTHYWNRESREDGEQPASDWSHRMRRMAAYSTPQPIGVHENTPSAFMNEEKAYAEVRWVWAHVWEVFLLKIHCMYSNCGKHSLLYIIVLLKF